jgi:hypothetical protein
MNPIQHPLLRALPLAGALLWPVICGAAAPGSAHTADLAPDVAPARLMAAEASAEMPADPPAPTRMISPRLVAVLAASLPRYVPAPKESAATETEVPTESTGSSDDILHLPKYVVHGPKSPVLRERDLSTPRALTQIAMKRYSSTLDRALNHYRLPIIGISPESRALAKYAEDERLQNMADLARIARNAALVDRAAGAELQRLADATYQRTE